ncbi:histone acetyltransferase [Haloarchaeobius sp. DYHT-AS-18]|uniref:histone acetyltransferase n=1 Tax=Haloarchaeobius sp. DYHT-AS-18 TaxID=3446117 RepID=UPI003EBEAFE4
MTDSFTLPIDEPQPSQLYLSQAKLDGVLSWCDPDDPQYDPLPVIDLDGEWTLIDGHTRAFVASLAGQTELRVIHDRDDHPRDLYRRCVDWCREADITRIDDLHGQLVSAETYQTQWINRCQAAAKAD